MSKKQALWSRLKAKFSKQETISELLEKTEHYNGYKREDAVRKLGRMGDVAALPVLIVRANDWVPEVRRAASEALSMLAVPAHADAFVEVLPELIQLRNCERDNHEEFVVSLEKYLADEEQALTNGVSHENHRIARACMALMIQRCLKSREQLVVIGLTHYDVLVRTMASSLISELTDGTQQTALEVALKDCSMPIRRSALSFAMESGIDRTSVEQFLFDRHVAIREMVTRYLTATNVDVRAIYKEAISSPHIATIRCAIWGLGHCKSIADLLTIELFLNNPYPSIRKQALRTMCFLDEEAAERVIEKSLSDASPTVVKEAARLSRSFRVVFTAARLEEIVRNSDYPHTIFYCIFVSRRMNKWERLIFLFSALGSAQIDHEDGNRHLRLALMQWNAAYNRSATVPDKRQTGLLKSKMKEKAKMLSSSDFTVLMFTLRSHGLGI